MHNDLCARLDGSLAQPDGFGKIVVQALAQPLKVRNLHIENTPSLFQIVHWPMIVRPGARPGKNS